MNQLDDAVMKAISDSMHRQIDGADIISVLLNHLTMVIQACKLTDAAKIVLAQKSSEILLKEVIENPTPKIPESMRSVN